MEPFLYYLLRASFVMALFYGFYKLLFGKNTFHTFNRFSLIVIVMIVAVLPLFRFNLLPEKKAEPVDMETLPMDFSNISVVEITAPKIEIPWIELLTIIFVAGLLFALTRYLIGLFQLAAMIRKSEKQRLADETVLCVTDKNISPFSWLKYIVMSEKDVSADNRVIINHERAHIHLKHSLDMIFFDLFTCVFWFNPFSWLLRREIQSVHEYQADEQVLNNGIDAKQYQLLLIRKSVGEHKFALANNFRQRDLHKRITMMMKNKTNKQLKWKYTVAIPVLFLAMVTLSTPKLNAKVIENEVENAELIAEKITISGQVVDQTGKAIPMVAIINKDDNSGTITDNNGNFVFNVERGATVSFVMVGYKEQKVTFTKPEKNFKLTLEKGEGENKEIITVRIKGRDDVEDVAENQSKLTVSGFVKGLEGFLPGVAVTIKDSPIGTITDMEGKFVIKAEKGDVLRFMMVDYKVFEYEVEKSVNNLVVVLQPDDVIAVGSEKMEDLNGRVTGFRVNNDGKQPLYVVDGKRISNEELNDVVDPKEIESISVLKNNSAVQMYGEDGKNGVIIITTKTGNVPLTKTEDLNNMPIEKRPLIIVDGEKMPKDFDLNSVKPEEIESMSVLKGESATLEYGEEGKDGAIVIKKKNK